MSISELTERILAFRDAREWAQFHKPKDMVMALMLEAAELAEHFQWKSDEEALALVEAKRTELGDELADVLYWVILIAHDLGVDLEAAFASKMAQNEKKYPVHKAKGSHKKYTEL